MMPFFDWCLWNVTIPFLFLLTSIYLYNRMTMGWCKCNKDMKGLVCLVTGGNSGMGFETALSLAKSGSRVYIACRDNVQGERKTEQTIQIIRKRANNQEVYFLDLDLSSLQSVRHLTKQFLQREQRLDVLINNAGMTGSGRERRVSHDDRLELVMATNYFGHFLMTTLLLETIRKVQGRVITVSSIAQTWGHMYLDDLNFERNFPGTYNDSSIYGTSKLYLSMFSKELSEREPSIFCGSVHPGLVRTQIMRDLPWILRETIHFWLYFMGKDSLEGAQTAIHLAKCKKFQSGMHFADCKQSAFISRHVLNGEDRKVLWANTEALLRNRNGY